jgi:ribose transport system substrate-binding protein
MVASIEREVSQYCPSTCKVTTVVIPVTDWATRIQTEVQSAIVRDPNLNYIIPIYDGMCQFVVPGVVTAAAANRVKVASYNGTPFALKYLADQNVVSMDVGDEILWEAYANDDQIFRILAGVPPVEDEHQGIRIFDSSNVADTGNPPKDNTGYGDAFIAGYQQLWKKGG